MTTTDLVALSSRTERETIRTAVYRPRYQTEFVELLWQQRDISQNGRLVTIAVPLAGSTPDPDYGQRLAAVLDERWTDRVGLIDGARILSITARIEQPALAQPRLVLHVMTDIETNVQHLHAGRMATELRRAIRDLRRGYTAAFSLAA